MHEMCGAAGSPSPRISSTVASVPSRVEPPAPNVTEKNAGFSCASCARAARSLATPSGRSRRVELDAVEFAAVGHGGLPCVRFFLHASSSDDSAHEMML